MPRNKTAIDAYLENDEKLAQERKVEDIKLWRQWDNGGRKPEDLKPLLQRYEPLVARTVTMRAKGLKQVDQAAARGVVLQEVIKAINAYDPNRGAALMTHVFPRVGKSSRTLNRWQNMAYIPQGKAQRVGDIARAEAALREDGLPADAPAIREWMNTQGMKPMSVKQIEQTQKRTIKDIPNSAFESDPLPQIAPRMHEVLPLLRNELTPDEQRVFDLAFHATDPVRTPGALATQLSWTPSKVSRALSSIATKLKTYQ